MSDAAFWILAPVMVVAALGILVVRKPVHAALLLAVVMISLAVQYAALDAPFLFAVQIVVYTGAILMLFLFVLMLVGADAVDTVKETIKGQRLSAIVVSVALGATLITAVTQGVASLDTGLADANQGGNINAIADLIFSRYVLAFEVTSALLITAAIGAMVLAHQERLTPRRTQAELAAQRVKDWKERGLHLGPAAAPGTLATSNSVETPALLPDGSHLETGKPLKEVRS
ncbi:NADH-quinone oxidoreductase subunit J [Nocardioides sp. Kera G14]|uniref:NADH-quinone oxidoreductase subunit J n=1 Tax=Nocardioides sp. Kera G14 TaxID=2884264 RepID=UPI001D10C3EC|nr:NADH-quinone oxidoreductase subunit J [Nocardioides sp. Kera G14]UDY23909.1 NADH-quinone oxidoreductase subunit J [Nocardioides sp. Kera G14]